MRDWKYLHSRHGRIRASVLTLVAVLLAVPTDADSPEAAVFAQLDRTQRAVDSLQARLGLGGQVVAELVPRHPLLVAVSPCRQNQGTFRLKLEAGFVGGLTDEELDAVVAHELGHVWIFKHHPYLQTEQLANKVAMRVVTREALDRVYEKVEARGGKKTSVARFADHGRP